jgi:preprotein translocase subunit SecG
MYELIVVVDVLSALGIIGLVLLQQGKGADMGAAFGSGASATLFGSRGTANFLSRTTAVLAVVFFVCNIAIAYMAARPSQPEFGITGPAPTAPAVPEAPAAPAEPTAPSVPEVPK